MKIKPDILVHTYNPSTWEAEAKGSRVQGQPGLVSKNKRQGVAVHTFRQVYLYKFEASLGYIKPVSSKQDQWKVKHRYPIFSWTKKSSRFMLQREPQKQ